MGCNLSVPESQNAAQSPGTRNTPQEGGDQATNHDDITLAVEEKVK
jgi:hypothetical protein